MPAWLIPILKSVLPHVGSIVSAAAPVFTRKAPETASNVNTGEGQAGLLQQQITELQVAVSGNDVHIKDLALQMQSTVEALEEGVSLAEKRHQRIFALCIFAILMSVIAFSTALYVLLAR